MLTEKIYRANWVLPVSGSVITDGALHVKNGRILETGNAESIIKDNPSVAIETFPNSVLLPSWVNAHCHLELSAYHNKITDFSDFVNWVQQLIELRIRADRQDVLAKAEQAAGTLRKSGCALVGDVTNGDLLRADSIAAGPERVVLYEILGFDQAQAAIVFKTASTRIQNENSFAQLIPHALYSTSAKLVKSIAGNQNIFSIHLAESPQETEFIKSAEGSFRKFLIEHDVWQQGWVPPKMSPVQYLDHLKVLNNQSLLVHGVQVDLTDLKLIKEASATVCLCARSNDLLKVGRMPLEDYILEKIPIAIGTDSLASNIDLDMNNEIYYIYKQFGDVHANDLIQMATINGARALDKHHEYGSLEAGKKARFNIFSSDTAVGMDPAEFVVSKAWSTIQCF